MMDKSFSNLVNGLSNSSQDLEPFCDINDIDITDVTINSEFVKSKKFGSDTSFQCLSDFIKNEDSPKSKKFDKTDEIVTSLGIEQNDSVRWTSALETPFIENGDRNCDKRITTIEKLTLHPKHKAFARALFSPHTGNRKSETFKCSRLSNTTMSPLAKNLVESPIFKSTFDNEVCVNDENIDSEFDDSLSTILCEDDALNNETKNMLCPGLALTSTPVNPEKIKSTKNFIQNLDEFGTETKKKSVNHFSDVNTRHIIDEPVIKPILTSNAEDTLVKPILSYNTDNLVKPISTSNTDSLVKLNLTSDTDTLISNTDILVKPILSPNTVTVVKPIISTNTDTLVKPILSSNTDTLVKPILTSNTDTLVKSILTSNRDTLLKPFLTNCDNKPKKSLLSRKKSKFIYPDYEETIEHGPQIKLEHLQSVNLLSHSTNKKNISQQRNFLPVTSMSHNNTLKSIIDNRHLYERSDCNSLLCEKNNNLAFKNLSFLEDESLSEKLLAEMDLDFQQNEIKGETLIKPKQMKTEAFKTELFVKNSEIVEQKLTLVNSQETNVTFQNIDVNTNNVNSKDLVVNTIDNTNNVYVNSKDLVLNTKNINLKDSNLNTEDLDANRKVSDVNAKDLLVNSPQIIVNSKETITGFCCGSGNSITVSNTSLKKGLQLLDECSKGDDSTTNSDSLGINKLSSSKLLEINKLNDSNLLEIDKLSNLDPNTENPLLKMNLFSNLVVNKLKDQASFTGFCSGSGKRISVSEKSVEKVRELWEECLEDGNSIADLNGIKSNRLKKLSPLNKSKVIENNYITKSRHILNSELYPKNGLNNSICENSVLGNNVSIKEINDKVDFKYCSLSFKTASNKDVEINSNSLMIAKRLWEDTEITEKGNNKKLVTNELNTNLNPEIKTKFYPVLGEQINLGEQESIYSVINNKSSLDDEQQIDLELNFENKSLNKIINTNSELNNQSPVLIKDKFCTPKILSHNDSEQKSLSPVLGSFRVRHSKMKPKRRNLFINKETPGSDNKSSIHHSIESPINQKVLENNFKSPINQNVLSRLDNNYTLSQSQIGLSSCDYRNSIKTNRHIANYKTQDTYSLDNVDKAVKEKTDKNIILKKLFEQNLSNHQTNQDFGTQDITEMNKISEAFMLDNSWDDICQQDSPQSVTSKRQRLECVETKTVKKMKADKMINSWTKVESARKEQNKLLEIKAQNQPISVHGSLYERKNRTNAEKYKLSNFTLSKSNLSGQFNITPNSALLYRFNSENEIESIDGCTIIPGDDNMIGIEEIERAFLASPLVNSSMVPNHWVVNHYKWIVWKLFSYQTRLDIFNEPIFTPKEVIRQLKYRYDVELLEGRRSVLRKIFEQDDVPQKTMILCVASINIGLCQNSSYLSPLVLTDGWYSIGAQIDNAMMNLIKKKNIRVGCKLIIHGAELLGSPSPCHPLEASDTIQINLHTNMVRLAKWHMKLGLYSQFGPVPSTLISSILDDGGLVGSLDFTVGRKYPLIYLERSSGKSTLRSSRAHERWRREAEAQNETILQEVYSEVAKEMGEDCVVDDLETVNFLKEVSNGGQIVNLLRETNDPSCLQSYLTNSQFDSVSKWKQQREAERNSLIQREVAKRIKERKKLCEGIPMLKLGVIDRKNNCGIISIWRPQNEIINYLEEGKSYRIHYITPSDMRNGLKQFTWNKHSRIECVKPLLDVEMPWKERKVTFIDHLTSEDFSHNIPWGEIDVVGLVIYVMEPRDGRQIAFLSDIHMNFVTLKFWPSIQELGVTNNIVVGSLISVCNLSWKGRNEDRYPSLHVTPHTVFSNNPRQQYLMDVLKDLGDKLQDIPSHLDTCMKYIKDAFPSPHSVRTPNSLSKPPNLSPLRTIQMKSSPLIGKPFKVPFKSSVGK